MILTFLDSFPRTLYIDGFCTNGLGNESEGRIRITEDGA